MTNSNASPISCNEHPSQEFYQFDHRQQIITEKNVGIGNCKEQKVKDNRTTTFNDINEDEFCQICGDLASGWHCG